MPQLDYFPLPAGSYTWGSPYGPRGAGFHPGQDFPAAAGTPFYAVAAGQAVQTWDPSGGGNWTRLTTASGDVFGYGHASAFAHGPGTRDVAAGELLGYVGTTGQSTGPHLHFAFLPHGTVTYATPIPLLRAAESAGRFPGNYTPPQEVPDVTKDELDLALSNHITGLQAVLGQWIKDAEQIIGAGTVRAGLVTITEVRDLLAPLYKAQGLELPAIDVNSHEP